MTRDQWEYIATRFYVPKLLLKAIRQKVASITLDTHQLSDTMSNSTYGTLELRIINTSTSNQRGFAVSTAHFSTRYSNAGLTLAVVLGATQQQVDRIETLLRNAQEAIGHPLLMLGLSAELLLDLLIENVESMRDRCVAVERMFQRLVMKDIGKDVDANNLAIDVESVRSKASFLDEEIKTSRSILLKALNTYFGDIEATSSSDDYSGTERERFVQRKIRARFQDILFELDSLMTLTQISTRAVSSMPATEPVRCPLVALRLTYFQTILAMPIFDWGNDWRDWRYQPVAQPDTTSENEVNTAISPEARPPVFSGYFWIYLAVSVALSFATIEVWWRVVRSADSRSGRTGTSGDKPPHWTLYPVWSPIQSLM
ncbi:hypothetical protein OQA88_13378 [Cercophora sp. LCS_1]